MSKTLVDLERELSALPVEQRAQLASFLLATLEPADEGDIEAAWVQEAERRLAAFEAGDLEAISAEEVFAEARRRLGEGC
jgi:putative addiction module component (TIGR02574 family)